jgi:hypothetical protein
MLTLHTNLVFFGQNVQVIIKYHECSTMCLYDPIPISDFLALNSLYIVSLLHGIALYDTGKKYDTMLLTISIESYQCRIDDILTL